MTCACFLWSMMLGQRAAEGFSHRGRRRWPAQVFPKIVRRRWPVLSLNCKTSSDPGSYQARLVHSILPSNLSPGLVGQVLQLFTLEKTKNLRNIFSIEFCWVPNLSLLFSFWWTLELKVSCRPNGSSTSLQYVQKQGLPNKPLSLVSVRYSNQQCYRTP